MIDTIGLFGVALFIFVCMLLSWRYDWVSCRSSRRCRGEGSDNVARE